MIVRPGAFRAKGAPLFGKLLRIFSTGTNGFIYDPSDMASLYQDSAGTTPVTAVTNPVGKASDKSGNTNHALQSTAAARPTWTNRVNLLTYTEQFDNAAWVKWGGAVTPNTSIAPDGTTTADTFTELGTANSRYGVFETFAWGLGTYTKSVYIKSASGSRFARVVMANSATVFVCVDVDLSSGTITQTLATGGLSVTSSSISSASNGYWRVSLTSTLNLNFSMIHTVTTGSTPAGVDYGYESYTGDGTSGIYIWGAQLEVGTTATTYQRVTTATNFDTAGFPYYLSFLGTDDSLSSATGGGGSAGFFWCGAVLPTGGAGTLQTLFADNGTNTGYKVQKDVNNKLSFSAGDNAAFTTKVSTAALSVGTKYMLTVWDDGTNLNVQIDSAAAETVARPVVVAGTAGYTIAKDNGAASSFYIGNKYPGVYAKNTGLTAAQRATIQTWVKQKAGL